MYYPTRFFLFSFFFAFFAVLSVWTYPRHQFRGIASITTEYHLPYHYDASYKL